VRKWPQPRQRNRNGQAPPSAWTLDGSVQTPYGTAIWPTRSRARSLSSSAVTWRQSRLPAPSNWWSATRFDRGAGARLGDLVVGLGGVDASVSHQLAQHVDRASGIGVPLGVGVPVGVGHHGGVREDSTVGQRELGQPVDPRAVDVGQYTGAQRPGAIGIDAGRRQQDQVGRVGVRERGPNRGLAAGRR
jgi:hypothetical protein